MLQISWFGNRSIFIPVKGNNTHWSNFSFKEKAEERLTMWSLFHYYSHEFMLLIACDCTTITCMIKYNKPTATEILTTRRGVLVYWGIDAKKIELGGFFFWKEVDFQSRNLVKIHWWQNKFLCVNDVMVSTKELTQEKSLFWLSHFSFCLLCHQIILPRFRENWTEFFPKICITLCLLQSASKGTYKIFG